MTLIENLRAVDPWSEHDCYMSAPLFTRAADRIEALEAALREILVTDTSFAREIARTALTP